MFTIPEKFITIISSLNVLHEFPGNFLFFFENIFLESFLFYFNSQKLLTHVCFFPAIFKHIQHDFFHSTIFCDKQFHYCHDSSRKKRKLLLFFASENDYDVYPYTICFWLELMGEKKKSKVKVYRNTKTREMFHIWHLSNRTARIKIIKTNLYEKFTKHSATNFPVDFPVWENAQKDFLMLWGGNF